MAGQWLILTAEWRVFFPLALAQLDAQPAAVTRQMFDSIDGRWWDKRQRVPEKFLVLRGITV